LSAQWLKGEHPALQIRAKAGPSVRYVNPVRIAPERENHIYLRSMIVKSDAVLEISLDNKVIRSKKERHVQPSEMITVNLGPKDFKGLEINSDSVLEFSIK